MAGNVSNGGIGKSPAIDKLNRMYQKNIANDVSDKMETLISKHENAIFQPVPVLFANCKKEFRSQISNLLSIESQSEF